MDNTKTQKTLRVVLTVLIRLLVTVAVILAAVCISLHLILNTVLCGPSESARNALTLTLLESPRTRDIPGRYLSQEVIDGICASSTASCGLSDSSLIQPGTAETASAQLELENCAVQITLCDPSQITLPTGTDAAQTYAGFTAEGILVLSGDPAELTAQGIEAAACGPMLMLNGSINETLYGGASGYAPRTAIGQRADGTVILVTTDGWSTAYIGATYQDLIDIMQQYAAVNACILYSGNAEREG